MGELAAMEGLALAKQRIDESMPGAVQPALQAASDVRHEACCRVHGAFFQVRSAMKSGPQARFRMDADAARRQSRRRLIRLDVSQRPPPIFCTSP